MSKVGCLISGIAMPGAGKSSLFRHLGQLMPNAKTFAEPEEEEWGLAVKERDRVGHFTAMHWFRSTRVPMLYDAKAFADSGGVALVDSYYDKLCSYYLGRPGMEWLIAPDDPYFENYLQTAKIDLERLPDADAVVVFEVNKSDWTEMVKKRERQLDAQSGLLETFPTQQYFIDAADAYCDATQSKLVVFKNKFGTVDESANQLLVELKQKGVLQ